MKERPNESQRPRLAGWRARIVVILLALSPFIVLEVVLRATGFGRDPYTNFAPDARVHAVLGDRVFRDPVHGEMFRTRPFAVEKPPGTTRIFAVGDSVTFGFTYHSRTQMRSDPFFLENAYPRLLEGLLSRAHSGRAFEVLNCGGLGHASFRLLGVVRQVVNLSPDLVIVMTGSSEFPEARTYMDWKAIHESRTGFLRDWRTLTLLRDLLRSAQADEKDVQDIAGDGRARSRAAPVTSGDEVRDRYEVEAQLAHSIHNLEQMVAACGEAGVPLILCTAPADLRHPPHYRSRAAVQPDQRIKIWDGESNRERFDQIVAKVLDDEGDRFGRAVDLTVALTRRGEFEAALRAARTARSELEDDLRIAVLHYCEGRALDGLKRFAKAREAYEKARDLDLLPLRATGGLNEAIRALSGQPGVFLADVERAFTEAVPDGIPDRRLFFDNCHPNRTGHAIVAETIRKVIDTSLARSIAAVPLPGSDPASQNREAGR